MGKRYFWLKLMDDFFTQPKIKKLRRIAGGDTYTVIYLKMQLLSLKNEGVLYFEGTESNFSDEIALTIDEEPENVRFTIMYLMNQGLLEEISGTEFVLTETIKSIGSESSSAERVRKHRLNLQNNTKALQSNTSVTPCNTEKRREEKEREERREREERETEKIPYQKIADIYNAVCTAFPRCTVLSDKRKKAIKARIHSGYSLEDFRRLFEKAQASTFLKGGNDRNWRATFDWLITDSNMAKTLDGNYDDNKGGPQNAVNRSGAQGNEYSDLNRFI